MFVPLVSHCLHAILGSIYVNSSSLFFPIIGTSSRFYISSFFCSTRFSSLGQLSRFYRSSFHFSIFPFVTNHWDMILCFSHRLDTIQGSICVYSSFLLFPIIGMQSRFYISSFVWFTRFSSLVQHSRFYLCSSLFSMCRSLGHDPLVSRRLDTIWILWKFILSPVAFSSLGRHRRLD